MLSPSTNNQTLSHDPQANHLKHRRRHRRRRHEFLAAWVRSPKEMGALLPSSRRLAQAMVKEIDISIPGVIIELGAGTGVMTKALLQAGIPPERLLVVERDPKLHAVLSRQFQGLNVVCEDAQNLEKLLADNHITEVCGIISSLPFLTIPAPVGHAIQEQMAKVIRDEGVIVQFTYGVKSPICKSQLNKLQLKSRRTRIVITNVPPAHVWVYRKA